MAEVVTEIVEATTPFYRYNELVANAETVVEVKIVYVKYISDINTVDQTYKICVDFDLEWLATDADIASWKEGEGAEKSYTPEVVPTFTIANAKEMEMSKTPQANGNPYKLDLETQKNFVRVACVATCMVPYDLHSFPFDVQSLSMTLDTQFYAKEQLMFAPTPDESSYYDMIYWNTGFSATPEFEFRRAVAEFVVRNDAFSAIVLRFQVARKPLGYMFRIAFPLALLTLVTVAAFGFGLQDGFADRIAYLITLVLTFVAFAFVINSELPQVPYLTVLDQYNLTCFSVVVFLLIAVSIVKNLPVEDATRTAVDDIMFYVFMVGVVVINIAFAFLAWKSRTKELKKLKMTPEQLSGALKTQDPITAKANQVMGDSKVTKGGDAFLTVSSNQDPQN